MAAAHPTDKIKAHPTQRIIFMPRNHCHPPAKRKENCVQLRSAASKKGRAGRPRPALLKRKARRD
jgi:hypothetical protein